MKYSTTCEALDRAYHLIGRLFEVDDQPDNAMTISAALAACGEDRSWAGVWWAYGAIHHDLSDQSYSEALELLRRVERPEEACAAALMLRAEISFTHAVERDEVPDRLEQVKLLSEAVKLAPDWPNLHLRLARAQHDRQNNSAMEFHCARALALLQSTARSTDPFDTAISGRGMIQRNVLAERAALRISIGRGLLE